MTPLNRLHFYAPKEKNQPAVNVDRRPISTSSSSSDRCNMRATSSSSTGLPESTVRIEEVFYSDEEVDWNDVATNDVDMACDTDEDIAHGTRPIPDTP